MTVLPRPASLLDHHSDDHPRYLLQPRYPDRTAFQEFNGPYIITQGGPRNATTLVSLLVYNYAFKSNEMGMACALAWVMFIAVALLTVIAFTSQKHWVYYAD